MKRALNTHDVAKCPSQLQKRKTWWISFFGRLSTDVFAGICFPMKQAQALSRRWVFCREGIVWSIANAQKIFCSIPSIRQSRKKHHQGNRVVRVQQLPLCVVSQPGEWMVLHPHANVETKMPFVMRQVSLLQCQPKKNAKTKDSDCIVALKINWDWCLRFYCTILAAINHLSLNRSD